jgi:glutathione synthase/RimK-type ligase-like ATP-grasp enzyme
MPQEEDQMKIAFVMQGRSCRHPIWSQVADRLAHRGAQVELLWPEEGLIDLGRVRVEHDLYVLKSGSPLGLSFAGSLHAAGAAILNPYPVAAMCRDKIVTSHVLAAAGVPTPETWVTDDAGLLRGLLDGGPIVVKPYRGSRGMGVQVITSADELDAAQLDEGPLFVQRYHAPDGNGLDYKMYCIAGEVFGVRRVWPSRTAADKLGQPFVPGEDLVRIARGCSAAIGVDTFGFDIVFSDGVPYVVDLSSWPGFKGVPNNVALLTEAIERAAWRARRGDAVTEGLALAA